MLAVFAPVTVLFLIQALFEIPPWSHAIDDLLIAILGATAVVVILRARKAGTLGGLQGLSRLGISLGIAVALLGALAVVLEFKDPGDLADDPLTIIGGLLMVFAVYWVIPGAGAAADSEYRNEWLRARTTVWFFPFFLIAGVSGLIVHALMPFEPFGYAESAALLVVGILGVALFLRSRAIEGPKRLHSINNLFLIAAIIVLVFALADFDFASLGFAVVLVVNRFV